MTERRAGRGFTLIELLMVVVIIGVLAVTAMPKFFDRKVFDERGYFDAVKSATRYARAHAVATGCDVQIAIGGTGFALNRRAACDSGAFSVPVADPAAPGGYASAAPAGVTASPPVTVYFDNVGRPRDGASVPLASTTTIAVGSQTLVIEPETGYAHSS